MAQSAHLRLFNAEWYLAQNPDVAAAVDAGLLIAEEHFRLFGNAEGRSPGPLFDTQYYLAASPDVAAAVAQGLLSAYDHFVQFGASENRPPLSLFDTQVYLTHSPDVARAVAAGAFSAIEHFLMFGHAEGRIISPFIDLGAYTRANPDIAATVTAGGGQFDVMSHLLQYGVGEGRDLGNGVNLGIFANDPAFQAALGNGSPQTALERVGEVAPFLPGFVPPPGWTPPANTPIPLDFIPPEGMKLVVPPGVIVPPGTVLPDTFEPITPPAPPRPQPDGDDGWSPPTFTVTNENGERVFGGTATGLISTTIDGDGIVSFSRGGITVKTDLDLTAWATNQDFVKVRAGQTLVLSQEEALLFAAALDCGCLGSSFAIVGNGSVRIDTDYLDTPDNLVSLLAISPELKMSFLGGNTVTVADSIALHIHPAHADGVVIEGNGVSWVAGNESARGPVTLDVGTDGPGNMIIATPGDDSITVRGGGLNTISPGKGSDTIILAGCGMNAITIEAGAAARYVMEVAFNITVVGEDYTISISLGDIGQVVIAEFKNGEWGKFIDAATRQEAHGLALDTDTGTVTIVRDAPFHILAAALEGGGSSSTGSYPDSTADYGVSPHAADSHFWQMDEIHGFTPGNDVIFSAHLYVGGDGKSVDMLDDGDFTTADNVTFEFKDGIATVIGGSLPEQGALQYVLEQLSIHMNDERYIVAYEHDRSTYLLHGDGKSGLDVSDMVVKLAGVEGVCDLSEIIG